MHMVCTSAVTSDMAIHHLWPVKKNCPLKYTIPVNTLLYSLCILSVVSALVTLSASMPGPATKWVYFLFNFVISMCRLFLKLLLALDLPCFVCLLICLWLCWLFVVSQFMLSSCCHSQSGIPNNAHLISLHTIKKLPSTESPYYGDSAYSHLWYAWVICACIYYFLSIDLFGSVMFLCRKNILCTMMGIKLQSLQVSISYNHMFLLLWLLFVFSFAIITDLM